MNFTYGELIVLNQMVAIALMSGKIELDKTSESVHKKVSEELVKQGKENLEDKKAG